MVQSHAKSQAKDSHENRSDQEPSDKTSATEKEICLTLTARTQPSLAT